MVTLIFAMLFTYNAIHNVIRLPYMVRRGRNDMHDDMRITVNTVNMVKMVKGYSRNAIRCSIVIFQIPIIIAQVGYELPKTKLEVRMTTAAGTVIQLMGSDEQYDLPVFPVVLAYNRINQKAPTHYLSDTSLSD